MNIYAFMNSIPDYVSNPVTANNVTIMISSLKDKFGDKLHETTNKGYLTAQDMIPYKYYNLYLWYWCDNCYYGIRECTWEDFNIKEEKKMTKDEALRRIEELKEYVEKCEEKEKEIPEMPRHDFYNIRLVVPDKPRNTHISWDGSFENQESADLYGISAFELANLIYAREYLKVDVKELVEACKYGYAVSKLVYDITECKYVDVNVSHYQAVNERDYVWCFTDKEDSEKVRDYMNKYVAHVKKNMF